MYIKLFFLFLLLFSNTLSAKKTQRLTWQNGETYLQYLERHNIPQSLYYNSDKEDQKLTEEIMSGAMYFEMYDDNATLEQVLIPISDELQLHIYKEEGSYKFDTLPIEYRTKDRSFALKIEHSPAQDIYRATGSKRITYLFTNSFKRSLDFRRNLRKGDDLVMVYTQKYRLNHEMSLPELKVAMIEMRNKKHYIYNYKNRYYNEKAKEVDGFLLGLPVKHARISSGFTKRRYHPILKRYRAHLGIDYAAPRGTPIHAAGNGKIIFAGFTRGYGNLIKIAHAGGYMTLYAHQKKFARGIHRGMHVKKGQTIGYIGTTGLSTGPHLHFGLYKNGRAINPASVIKITKRKLSGRELRKFKSLKRELDAVVEKVLESKKCATVEEIAKNKCFINMGQLEKRKQ